jgi:catechol 2,3-dioxygenase-like lactoylglutathione lyase family enzyme
MGITGVDHLYIETRSFEKGRAFWESLGFELKEKWGEDGHVAGLLNRGQATVVLAEVKAGEKPEGPTIHFGIDGADAYFASLSKQASLKIVTKLESTHWGTRWIRVEDPDGRVFALEEPRREKPAPNKAPAKKKASAAKKKVRGRS